MESEGQKVNKSVTQGVIESDRESQDKESYMESKSPTGSHSQRNLIYRPA